MRASAATAIPEDIQLASVVALAAAIGVGERKAKAVRREERVPVGALKKAER